MKRKEVTKLVHDFKTKNKEGFTPVESSLFLLVNFPDMNMEKYNSAMRGNTCMVIDGVVITYHCDIITGIMCGIEDRDMYGWEWD